MGILEQKSTRLAVILSAFFLTNIFVAEFIGVKIFSLETTLGFNKWNFSLFGKEGLSFDLTCGVLIWPFVFVLTDIINEYFGPRGVRFLSWLSVILISYAFLSFSAGMKVTSADWWPGSQTEKGIPDMNAAFNAVFGQGLWIIIGSIVAFLIGQLADVSVFHWIKKRSGEKNLWMRSTVSTLVSQFIDSYVVLFIAFYLGANWDWRQVLAIGMVNYAYKFIMAMAMIPVIYFVHLLIDRYLGSEESARLRKKAMLEKN